MHTKELSIQNASQRQCIEEHHYLFVDVLVVFVEAWVNRGRVHSALKLNLAVISLH